MSIYRILNAAIYPYFEKMLEYLKIERNSTTDEDLNRAINLNIILSCACLLEGIFESKIKGIVRFYEELFMKVDIPEFEIRKPMNIFFHNICDDLKQRISQSMGVDKYDDLCKMLLEKSFKQDTDITPHIEAIQVLFQLRNVIAHGREISALEKVTDIENMVGDEFFFGGYKKAETFLLRKCVIKNRFIRQESASIFFVNEVADYFLDETYSFLTAFNKFVDVNLKNMKEYPFVESLEEIVREFNSLHGTNFTAENFFENVEIEISGPQ